MKTLIRSICCLILLSLISAILYAQQEKVPAKPAEPKYTEIKYTAEKSSYRWQGEDRILVLVGNVKFVQGDTVLLADKVDYRESTKTANATGNLKIYDQQSTITGESCAVNFKEKKVKLTGKVHMVAKPKKKDEAASKAKSQWKDEVTVACEEIEYFYKDKKANVPCPVTIVQKERTVTADSATYDGKAEILNLVGNVKGKDDKDKHTFAAPKVILSLKDNDEWMEAEKASGSFYVNEEEEAEKPAEKPTPQQPAETPSQ